MPAYYNEIDPFAAQWLRNLIDAGHIAPGEVDERSIVDVRGDDLRGFEQCHFFAGIGCWSYALRLAGWPDDRRVWTGSCPCQPFSAAGRRGGRDDERHLWPDWSRLISECEPVAIFGEQVADSHGLSWLDFVCADLETAGYTVGAVDTCAAGFGLPHGRQRILFVAHADEGGRAFIEASWLHDSRQCGDDVAGCRPTVEWIECRDGKRPIEPGVKPVVDGTAAGLGRLRAYGNAIVAPQAAQFIRACMT